MAAAEVTAAMVAAAYGATAAAGIDKADAIVTLTQKLADGREAETARSERTRNEIQHQ